jgi:acyl carrier protein
MSEPSKQDAILQQLRDIMEESSTSEINWDSYSLDSTVESLGLDSLTILDLLYDIEQEIGVQIEAKEVVEFRTLGEIVELLIKKSA